MQPGQAKYKVISRAGRCRPTSCRDLHRIHRPTRSRHCLERSNKIFAGGAPRYGSHTWRVKHALFLPGRQVGNREPRPHQEEAGGRAGGGGGGDGGIPFAVRQACS